MTRDHFLTPFTKINLKWIKDLNVHSETIKFLEEKIGSMLLDIGLSNNFFGSVFSGKAAKAKIIKWNYNKLKRFCTERETIDKMRRQPTKWEMIVAKGVNIQNV